MKAKVVKYQRQPFHVFQFHDVLLTCCYVQKIKFTIVTQHKINQNGITYADKLRDRRWEYLLQFYFILHLKALVSSHINDDSNCLLCSDRNICMCTLLAYLLTFLLPSEKMCASEEICPALYSIPVRAAPHLFQVGTVMI